VRVDPEARDVVRTTDGAAGVEHVHQVAVDGDADRL